MKISTVMITHNRLDYSKKTLESYLDTIHCDWEMIVVDNASTDGTQEWLEDIACPGINIILLPDNRFPGAAANLGWLKIMREDVTHLQRTDNDVEYLPGWSEYVEAAYDTIPNLGQFGVLTAEQSGWLGVEWNPLPLGPVMVSKQQNANIGGNCVVPVGVWNHGVRYQETQWEPGANEDWFFSSDIRGLGMWLYVAGVPIALNQSFNQKKKYPEYTDEVAGRRSYHPDLIEALYNSKDL